MQEDRLSLITALRKSDDSVEIARLVSELDLRDVKEHTMSISAFTRARDYPSALALVDTMKERGIKPTSLTFQAALAACAKAGEWERAQAMLDEMRQQRMAPDGFAFNAAISACARAGEWRPALKLLDTMRKVGCP